MVRYWHWVKKANTIDTRYKQTQTRKNHDKPRYTYSGVYSRTLGGSLSTTNLLQVVVKVLFRSSIRISSDGQLYIPVPTNRSTSIIQLYTVVFLHLVISHLELSIVGSKALSSIRQIDSAKNHSSSHSRCLYYLGCKRRPRRKHFARVGPN